MESWEDELLLDDDFSDEEEDAEEQIEETGLEMDADGFADWEDSSDTAPVDETLEEALAEERTLELDTFRAMMYGSLATSTCALIIADNQSSILKPSLPLIASIVPKP